MMDNLDQEYLEQLHKHSAETCRLWSNAMKPERERMICRALLRGLEIPFSEEELINGPEEPIDISFRDARFQITEILDGGRRRGEEWRMRRQRYAAARTIEDVLEPSGMPSPVSYETCLTHLEERLCKKEAIYGSECHNLDALVYVNLKGRFLDTTTPRPMHDRFCSWRSVSMVFLPYGEVLFAATTSAPDFLRSVQGKAYRQWPGPDGWFDV